MTAKLKFHEKFSFELPIVLKTDFIRTNDALSRDINLYPQHHIPVDDFCLENLLILSRKIAQKIGNNENSPKYLIFTSDEKDTIQNVYNYVIYQFGTKLIWFLKRGLRNMWCQTPKTRSRSITKNRSKNWKQ